MKWKTVLAVVGAGLLALGVASLSFTSFFFGFPLKFSHRPPDRHIGGHGWRSGNPDTSPICEVVPVEANKEIDINTSFPLTITVKPTAALGCHADVYVSAPAFDVKPESQRFDLPDKEGNQTKTYTFLLVPKQAGTQLVSVNSEGGQEILYYSIRSSEFVPAWMNPFVGPFLSVFGSIFTIPWWIERQDKKRDEAKRGKKVADQKRLGLLMEGGQHLYKEIADLQGEDLEAWDARLKEWQTSVRKALEEINFPADYPEFTRATDEIEPLAIAANGKNLKWKQEVRRRKLQKQQQKLEDIVKRRLS
jgi:hypothetical protein